MQNAFTKIFLFTFLCTLLCTYKSIAQSWSPELKTVFVQNCITGFKTQAKGNEDIISAEDYCECAYEKIQKKYTMMEFAELALKGDITQNNEIQQLMLSCFSEKSNVKIVKPTFEISEKAIKNGWSAEYQTVFLSSCIGMAKQYDQNNLISSLFDVDAYCNCALQKIADQFNVLETTKENFFVNQEVQTIMIKCLLPEPSPPKNSNLENKTPVNDINEMNNELENLLKQQGKTETTKQKESPKKEHTSQQQDETLMPKTWTPEIETIFLESCEQEVEKEEDVIELISSSKNYCNCLLQKIKAEFTPNQIFSDDANEIYKQKIGLFGVQCLDKDK